MDIVQYVSFTIKLHTFTMRCVVRGIVNQFSPQLLEAFIKWQNNVLFFDKYICNIRTLPIDRQNKPTDARTTHEKHYIYYNTTNT